jgi:tetratricopeptide (TPR) repeat protein
VTKPDLQTWVRGEKTLGEVFNLKDDDHRAIAAIALSYYKTEQYADAIAIYEGLLGLGYDLNAHYATLASAYQLTNQTEKAVETYVEALQRAPANIYLLTNLAELLLNRGRLAEAHDLIKKAIALDPDSKHPAGLRARALAVKGARMTKAK